MYKIRSITLKTGEEIALGDFTILVGPNNAGKSQLLRDVGHCISGKESSSKILRAVNLEINEDTEALLGRLLENEHADSNGNFQILAPNGDAVTRNKLQFTSLKLSASDALRHIREIFTYRLVNYLTTEHRLTFSKRQSNFENGNVTGLLSLVKIVFDSESDIEAWLSDKTLTAFNLSIKLDNVSNAGALEFRVLSPEIHAPFDRIALRQFFKDCPRLDEQGDGLRSFVATLGATKSLPGRVLLIDEPEALLHPPQAYQAGRIFGEESFDGKQIICATHSAHFLRGVLAGGRDVTIVRLSRTSRGQGTSVLRPEDLRTIANDPVLSSGRILDGIFYQSVIITESDGDAVLYGSISAQNDPSGEIYYVNSYGKAATASVAAPYRKMGVPYAAIVDLDLIRVAAEFKKVARLFMPDSSEVERLAALVSVQVEGATPSSVVEIALQKMDTLRSKLNELKIADPDKQLEWLRARMIEIRSDASVWSEIKRRGVNAAFENSATCDDLESLLHQCAQNGLFLVPVGERESWLVPEVPYTKKKSAYTIDALNYIKSAQFSETSELSKFMQKVHSFLKN